MKDLKKLLLVLSLSCFLVFDTFSQPGLQKVTGLVFDKADNQPLAGATIQVDNSDLIIISDKNGIFKVSLSPGYHQFTVSFVGYQTKKITEVLVTTSRLQSLDIPLETTLLELSDANVSARQIPISISSREISPEAVKRYAATFYDPVRLSISLPSVNSTNDQNNDVSVRGTSPTWNQWRLEGLEIASPNHLTNAGTFSDRPAQNGGGVNILSAQMLDNSSVLYGNFRPGYGNALGAIFDMNLRNGSRNGKYHTVQASLLGLDLSTEGRFNDQSEATYLINYRYSFTGLLAAAGVDFGGEEIKFQDLSFNLYFPYKNGSLKVFGIGGVSNNDFTGVTDLTEAEEEKDISDINYEGKMMAVGFKNRNQLSAKWSIENTFIYSLNHSNRNQLQNFPIGSLTPGFSNEGYNEDKISFKTEATTRLGEVNSLSFGYNAVHYQYKLPLTIGLVGFVNSTGISIVEANDWLLQPYALFQGFLTPDLQLTGGLHLSGYARTDELNFEPRISLKKFVGQKSDAVYVKAGMYSQVQSFFTRFARPIGTFDINSYPNQDLETSKARKFQLGYLTTVKDWAINVETYFDYYYDLPFQGNTFDQTLLDNLSSFNTGSETVLNAFDETSEARVAGIDLSLEKKLTNKWYYLLGATYYHSEYKDLAGTWKESRWNGAYAGNATLGKEIQLKSKNEKNRSLSMNARIIYQGGFRRTALDTELSSQLFGDRYLSDTPFQLKNPNYFRLDLRVAWRVQKEGYTRTLSIDLQNATNYENFSNEKFDKLNGQRVTNYQLGIIPLLTYRVEF